MVKVNEDDGSMVASTFYEAMTEMDETVGRDE